MTASKRVGQSFVAVLVLMSAAAAGAQSLVPPPSPPLAPEIDAGTLGGAIAMLVCGALLFMSRVRYRFSEQKS